MTRARTLMLTAILLAGAVAPARADITAFLGANTTPANRHVTGVAVGFGLVIIGFEFEYASTTDDPLQGAPTLRTGMGNVLLQSPVPIFGAQPYITTGAGLSREELEAGPSANIPARCQPNGCRDTSIAFNTGGGVKIDLAGPLRLRVDYRIFKLGNNAVHSPAHRIYVGLNLRF